MKIKTTNNMKNWQVFFDKKIIDMKVEKQIKNNETFFILKFVICNKHLTITTKNIDRTLNKINLALNEAGECHA